MPIYFFFFNDTATTEIYTLSLHDALPISGLLLGLRMLWRSGSPSMVARRGGGHVPPPKPGMRSGRRRKGAKGAGARSEEHTSELQSRQYLVCRLLLEKKKTPSRSSLRRIY